MSINSQNLISDSRNASSMENTSFLDEFFSDKKIQYYMITTSLDKYRSIDFISNIISYIESKDLNFGEFCTKDIKVRNPFQNEKNIKQNPLEQLFSSYISSFQKAKNTMINPKLQISNFQNQIHQNLPLDSNIATIILIDIQGRQICSDVKQKCLDLNLSISFEEFLVKINEIFDLMKQFRRGKTIKFMNEALNPIINHLNQFDPTIPNSQIDILINTLKLQLYMSNFDLHSSFLILLDLLIYDQNHPEMEPFITTNINENTSTLLEEFTLNNITVITNFSYDSILDYCFTKIINENNLLFLTKDGLFKCDIFNMMNFDLSELTKVDLNLPENSDFYKILNNCDKEKVKMTFSDDFLIIFFIEKKTVFKFNLQKDDTKDSNQENYQVSISDYPVISIGFYDNYLRIIQQKEKQDKKATFIFTNIDLKPEQRSNSNKLNETEKIKQNQFEFELEFEERIDFLFSQEFMFIYHYNNLILEKWSILDDGILKKINEIEIPVLIPSDSRLKAYGKYSLFSLSSLKNNDQFGVSITKYDMSNWDYFFTENSALFMRFPLLQSFSNITDYLLDILINSLFDKKLKSCHFALLTILNKNYLEPSYLNKAKDLILQLKDIELKSFFISIFIKFITINLFKNFNEYYTEGKKHELILSSILKFIVDLYSSLPKCYDNSMVNESFFSIICWFGKCLFIPNSKELMIDIIKDLYSVIVEKQKRNFYFFNYLFSSPLGNYILNQSSYDLIKNSKLDINYLLSQSLRFFFLCNEDELETKLSFIDIIFQHIETSLNNNQNGIQIAELLLSYLFNFDISNLNFLLEFEKRLIKLIPTIYKKIKEIPEVINDDKFFTNLNISLFKQEHNVVETKTITIDENSINTELEINFNPKVNYIKIFVDKNSKLNIKDYILLNINDEDKKFYRILPLIESSNKFLSAHSNKIKITYKSIDRFTKLTNVQMILKGMILDKISFWQPNKHLYFYNFLLYFLFSMNSKIYNSTPVDKKEKEFDFILNDEIVQGIKFEDIDQYEKMMQQEQVNKNDSSRKITRGISRGISYDSDSNNDYNDEIKKDFIKNIIAVKKKSKYELFINFMYDKVKSNITKLNKVSEKTLEIEHYYIACLLKQLGLISLCKDTTEKVALTRPDERKNIKIPNQILFIWQKVMELRKNLFFKRQKIRQSVEISIFDEYMKEIKYKCILFLYSDSILYLKFKNNWDKEKIESAAKSIYSFVTSEITIKSISELIDIRRKRLFISNESSTLISSFINQNLMFETSKPVFTSYCTFEPLLYKLRGLKRSELDEYYKSFSNLSIKIIENIFNQVSFSIIKNPSFLLQPLFDHDIDESKLKCAQLLIDLLNKIKDNDFINKNQISFNLILILFGIASQTKSSNIIDSIISLLCDDSTDFNSKYCILYYIPYYIKLIPENKKVLDENLALSLLQRNRNIPIIVNLLIEWLGYIFNSTNENETERHSFILKILKGIGNSFVGKNCLFIDDSYQPFAHRQIAESMISFIRNLFNSQNKILVKIIHEILTNTLKNIKFNDDENEEEEELIIVIGLFASIGSEISALEPTRRLTKYPGMSVESDNFNIAVFKKHMHYNNYLSYVYTNLISIDPSQFDLNQIEIENLLQLHEIIIHSDYINNQDYESLITQKEIMKSFLIATFYSFLPIILQNKNNAELIMNKDNLINSLSLFNFAKEKIPSNENQIFYLSHYLEAAVSNSLYNLKATTINETVDLNGSFRFVKLNTSEVVYSYEEGKNDIIRSDPTILNMFICNRMFKLTRETYFEVKINKIGSKNIFIGFIDAEEPSYNTAFGFGSLNNKNVFCRRIDYLSNFIHISGDKIMANENKLEINEGDSIGSYFTQNYVYLTKNGKLTPYRLFHKFLLAYIPIIIIDHDEVELEINQNVSIVDNSNKFNFLNISEVPEGFFEANDFKSIDQIRKTEGITDITFPTCIGSWAKISETAGDEFKNNYCIIKDIMHNNEVVVDAYSQMDLSRKITELSLSSVKQDSVYFFNSIENINNAKFGYNSSFDMDYLPDYLQIDPDLNKIRSYLKNKTIKENSKSIAIIMTRYLAFILVDYLRYSKSDLLYEKERIKSNEMQTIIQSLAHSLTTITLFSDKIAYQIPETYKDYLIFSNTKINDIKCLIPGSYIIYTISFQGFLKETENNICPQFYIDLFQSLFNISDRNCPSSYLYKYVPSFLKTESVYPLPENYDVIDSIFEKRKKEYVNNMLGFLPIMPSPIPEQLSSVNCMDELFRNSSDQISFYKAFKSNKANVFVSWNLKENTKLNNYQLKLGLLLLSNKLENYIIDSSLGFIQIIILLVNTLNPSGHLMKDFLNRDIIDKLLSLSNISENNINPLIYPFIRPLILILQSVYSASDMLLSKNSEQSIFALSGFCKDICLIKDLPVFSDNNYITFVIYSILIKSHNTELLLKNNEIDKLSLFETYFSINRLLFSFGSNYYNNFYYLLFCYSILCNNHHNLPYPKFLFVHERMRQHYGGFRHIIKKFNNQNFTINEVIYNYRSEIIENNFDLVCLFNLIRNTDTQNPISYRVFIHQIKDNKIIEIHENEENVSVSFPLEILVQNPESEDQGIIVLDFNPSKQQQKEYFITNYNNIQTEFDNFISSETQMTYSFLDYMQCTKIFEIGKIPNSSDNSIGLLKKSVFSLQIKYFILLVNSHFHLFNDQIFHNLWEIPPICHKKKLNLNIDPIIHPLKQIDIKGKLDLTTRFVEILFNTLHNSGLKFFIFNRFEADKFKDNINEKADPLFIQLMKQIQVKELPKLTNTRGNPFIVRLVNEQGADAGGPGREIFSNLVAEMMDDNLGIFTTNPNMRNEINDVNKEDLIINKQMRPDIYHYENPKQFSNRLIYAGALIAICIISKLHQQMNLASFIWEYLLNSNVSIENIYEIDNEFKNFITNAENLLDRINSSSISDDELESNLIYSFEIVDSFGSTVELIPSGSTKSVTKDNLSNFIEMAKDFRIHEFDEELKKLKIGFNLLIDKPFFLSILDPQELKLFACGDKECKVERMKELIEITDNENNDNSEKKIEMFWNVMESFSIHERLLFIRFSSGYMGLPSRGLSWPSKLKVYFERQSDSSGSFCLPRSHTCFLTVIIPFFQTEQELKNMLLIAIKCEFYGNS